MCSWSMSARWSRNTSLALVWSSHRKSDWTATRPRVLRRQRGVTSSRPTITPSVGSVLRYRFLHERGDPCLFGGSQPLERECVRPHVALVEVRLITEAERRVPRLELRCCLEEADDLAVLG